MQGDFHKALALTRTWHQKAANQQQELTLPGNKRWYPEEVSIVPGSHANDQETDRCPEDQDQCQSNSAQQKQYSAPADGGKLSNSMIQTEDKTEG